MTLEEIFNETFTENGDKTFKSTMNPLLDILFMTEYFTKNLDEVHIGNSDFEKLFSMFIRDPRYGMGKRDLGRELMKQTNVSIENVVKAGRIDDLFYVHPFEEKLYDYLKKEIENGNELVKKWMPRYSSKNLMLARKIAKYWKMNKQQYGHFIKCNTVENKLSRKKTEEIKFEHVPSLAMIKYYNRFSNGNDTKERFVKYLADVKSGKKELKVSTTTVYDIYKNRETIDTDLFFSKIEKISGSWLPIVDTSGSMWDSNDSYGKAVSIGHYLAKCSTYAPNKVLSFSSNPQLITLGRKVKRRGYVYGVNHSSVESTTNSTYLREIESMYTGDCTNTDFGAVMDMLKKLDKEHAPEWLIVLSDMQFDYGSSMSKDETMKLFKDNGFNTKIVWWNFNSRNSCSAPETDKYGNLFFSGYSPMLLKYLECGFDGMAFLKKLVSEYANKIGLK